MREPTKRFVTRRQGVELGERRRHPLTAKSRVDKGVKGVSRSQPRVAHEICSLQTRS